MTNDAEMIPLGMVAVVAEHVSHEEHEHFVLDSDPVWLTISATQEVLSRLGKEAVKAMAFEIVGNSKWAARIADLPEDETALLPSPKEGVYVIVQRRPSNPALGILDFQPHFTVDWSGEGDE